MTAATLVALLMAAVETISVMMPALVFFAVMMAAVLIAMMITAFLSFTDARTHAPRRDDARGGHSGHRGHIQAFLQQKLLQQHQQRPEPLRKA